MELDRRYDPGVPFSPQQNHWEHTTSYYTIQTAPTHPLEGYGYAPIGSAYPIAGTAADRSEDLTHSSVTSWQKGIPDQHEHFTATSPQSSPSETSVPQPEEAAVSKKRKAPSPKKDISSSAPRRTLTDFDKINMCVYARDFPSKKQIEIGEVFGVERSTVSKVLRNSAKWLSLPPDEVRPPKKRRHPSVERTLDSWAKKEMEMGHALSDDAIRKTANMFLQAQGAQSEPQVQRNDPKWVESFRSKHRPSPMEEKDLWAHTDRTHPKHEGAVIEKTSVSPSFQTSQSSVPTKSGSAVKVIKRPQSVLHHDSGYTAPQSMTPPQTVVTNSPMPIEDHVSTTLSTWHPIASQEPSHPLVHTPAHCEGHHYFQAQPQYHPQHHYQQNYYHALTPAPVPSPYAPSTSSTGSSWDPSPASHTLPLGLSAISPGYAPHQGPVHYLVAAASPRPDIYPPPTDFKAPVAAYAQEPPPTVDQAQEALQTLRKYLARQEFSASTHERETLRWLEGFRLQAPAEDPRRLPAWAHGYPRPRESVRSVAAVMQ